MCLQDGEGAVQDTELTPDMNGHGMPVTPKADGTAACNGVHPEEISQGSNNGSETPSEAPEVSPEIYKVGSNCTLVHAWTLDVPLGIAETWIMAGMDAGHARARLR